eukprot:m.38567 g.38567  ORF g.38567 m.38567 type:complete len:1187 (-) comp9451_c0_seq1:68-3628(-)
MPVKRARKVLWLHDSEDKTGSQDTLPDVLINPELFPEVQVGDVLDLHQPVVPVHVLVQVQSTQNKLQPGGQISVNKSLAEEFLLQSREEVVASVIQDRKAITLEIVDVYFKDQYIGRVDMRRLKTHLGGQCVYSNKVIRFAGMRARIGQMWNCKGQEVSSGLISENTHLVFRSFSAGVYVLVEMSAEMWHLGWEGIQKVELVAEFVNTLIDKWDQKKCTHTLSVILFCRKYYPAEVKGLRVGNNCVRLRYDAKKRGYHDFYRVIVNSRRMPNKNEVVVRLRQELNTFKTCIKNSCVALLADGEPASGQGVIAPSRASNVLEAINLALTALDLHFINRSFIRTGLSVTVLTAGSGVYDVDKKVNIITERRVMDGGFGVDVISLTDPPFHLSPVFRWVTKTSKNGTSSGVENLDFIIPAWLHHLFYFRGGRLLDNQNPSPEVAFKRLQEAPLLSPTGWQIATRARLALDREIQLPSDEIFSSLHTEFFDVYDRDVWNLDEKLELPAMSQDDIAYKMSRKKRSTKRAVSVSDEDLLDHHVHAAQIAAALDMELKDENVKESLTDNEVSATAHVESKGPSTQAPIPVLAAKALNEEQSNETYAGSYGDLVDENVTVPKSVPSSPERKIHRPLKNRGRHPSEEKRLPNTRSRSVSRVGFSIMQTKQQYHPFRLNRKAAFESAEMDRRWGTAFSKRQSCANSLDGREVWKTLSGPAQLPLTTEAPPPEVRLKETHICLPEYEIDIRDTRAAEVMERMVMQRVAQCYQICESPSESDAILNGIRPLWLGYGSNYHKLEVVTNLDKQGVRVTQYVSKERPTETLKQDSYCFCLSNGEQDGSWGINFSSMQSHWEYNWKKSDESYLTDRPVYDIAEEDKKENELKYWRLRLGLLPLSKDSRVKNFEQFLGDLNRIIRTDHARESDGSNVSTGGNINKDESGEDMYFKVVSFEEGEEMPAGNILLGRKLNLQIDPQRTSGREESCTVHYDSHYSPTLAFHFEFSWLEATSCLVSQLVSRWTKRAEVRGFRLAPLPIPPQGYVSVQPNPFSVPVDIILNLDLGAMPLETDDEALVHEFQHKVLSYHGFLKNMFGEFPSYVHSSGEAVVTITAPKRFAWMFNTKLVATPSRASSKSEFTVFELLEKLKSFCSNKDGLVYFWDTVMEIPRKKEHRRSRSDTRELWRKQIPGLPNEWHGT